MAEPAWNLKKLTQKLKAEFLSIIIKLFSALHIFDGE